MKTLFQNKLKYLLIPLPILVLGIGILAFNQASVADLSKSAAPLFFQGGNSFGGLGVLGTLDNFGLSFITNGSEKARIDNAGNVGIGTVNPTAKLHVVGTGNITESLGIGTLISTDKLEVNGGVRFGRAPVPLLTTLVSAMSVNDTVANVVSTAGYPTTGTLVINAEPMTYSGITSNSFTGLTRGVLGTVAVSHPVESSVQNYLQIILADSVTPRMVVTGSGDVGIGTVFPTVKLQVEGGEIRLFSTPGNLAANLFTSGSGSPGYFRLYSGGTGRVQISAATFDVSYFDAGNVGIGTSLPNAKLHIAGGDTAITTQGNGVILRATDGPNCYRITVNNIGILSTASVSCP